jgi:uncharacterized Rossmann fold enzyme
VQTQQATESVIDYIKKTNLVDLKQGDQVVIIGTRPHEVGNALDDHQLAAKVFIVGNAAAIEKPFKVCSVVITFFLH